MRFHVYILLTIIGVASCSKLDNTQTASPPRSQELNRGAPSVAAMLADVKANIEGLNLTTPEDSKLRAILFETKFSDKITAKISKQPVHGSATLTNGELSYSPSEDYFGTDTINLTLESPGLVEPASVNLSINVTPVPDAPRATGGIQQVSKGKQTNFRVSANHPDGLALSYVLTQAPAIGELTLKGSGDYLFDPKGQVGSTYFQFLAQDPTGQQSNVATVFLQSTEENTPPTAKSATFNLNINQTITGFLEVYDPDSPTLTTTVKTPGNGRLMFNNFGTASNLNNSFQFVPTDIGTTDFLVEVSDSLSVTTATLTFNVQQAAENTEKPRILCDGCIFDVDEDSSKLFSFAVNSPEGSTLQILSAPKNGIATLVGTNITYTPFADYNGGDTFYVAAKSIVGVMSDPVKMDISIKSIIDQPRALDFTINGDEDSDLLGKFVAIDPDRQLDKFEVVEVLANQIASVDISKAATGLFTVSPKPDTNGTVQIKYLAAGKSGAKSAPAIATIKIAAVNDKPVIGNVTLTTKEDIPITGEFSLIKDVDNTTHTYTVKTPPKNGKISQILNKTFTYLPNPDYFGSDSFTFSANDGIDESAIATVSITVTPVDDLPVIKIASVTLETNEDTPLEHRPVITHSDPEPVGLKVSKPAANGLVTVSADKVVYKPKDNFNGVDTFGIKATDGISDSNEQLVTVNVRPVNDRPIITDQKIFVDKSLTGKINAVDVDSDKLTFGIESPPKVGTLTLDSTTGSFSFSYTAGDNMPEDFAVIRISDGQETAYGRLIFNESTAKNNPPRLIMPKSISLDEGASTTFRISAFDLEDGGLSRFDIFVSGSLSFSKAIASDGSTIITVNAASRGRGTYSMTVSTYDSSYSPASGTVDIIVNDVNEAPPTVSGSYTVTKLNTSTTFEVPTKDGDGQILRLTLSTPAYGSWTLVSSGASSNIYRYTRSNLNSSLSDSVTIKLSDGILESSGTVGFAFKAADCSQFQSSKQCSSMWSPQWNTQVKTLDAAREFCERNASISNRCCYVDMRMGLYNATIYAASSISSTSVPCDPFFGCVWASVCQ